MVSAKTPEQQAVLHLHRARQLLVRQRVASSNHMRAILSEYGIVMPQGVKTLTQRLPTLLKDADNELPILVGYLLLELKEQHDQVIKRITFLEKQLQA